MDKTEVTKQIELKEQYLTNLDKTLKTLSPDSALYKTLEAQGYKAIEVIEDYQEYLRYAEGEQNPLSYERWGDKRAWAAFKKSIYEETLALIYELKGEQHRRRAALRWAEQQHDLDAELRGRD